MGTHTTRCHEDFARRAAQGLRSVQKGGAGNDGRDPVRRMVIA